MSVCTIHNMFVLLEKLHEVQYYRVHMLRQKEVISLRLDKTGFIRPNHIFIC